MSKRRGSTFAVGGKPKLQPRIGKDGYVADNFLGVVIPTEVRAAADILNDEDKADQRGFRRCLQLAFRDLCGDGVPEGAVEATGVPEDSARTLFAGLRRILQAASRCDVAPDGIHHDLLLAKLPQACAADITALLAGEGSKALSAGLAAARVLLPSVTGVRWRVDVVISTARLSKVLRPVITLELTLSTGQLRRLEMSVMQFHELRYCVAQSLKAMHDNRRNPLHKVLAAQQQRAQQAAASASA